MRHILDVEVIGGRYYLKLDAFDPIEVPPKFKVAMEDLIDEILEEGKSQGRRQLRDD